MLHHESFLRTVYHSLRGLCRLVEGPIARLPNVPRCGKCRHQCLQSNKANWHVSYIAQAKVTLCTSQGIMMFCVQYKYKIYSRTSFPSTLDTNSESVRAIGLLISRHCDRTSHHRAISATSAVDLMGRWWNWRRVPTILVYVVITTWRRWWSRGKHSVGWDLSILLTILFVRVDVVAPSWITSGQSVTSGAKVEIGRVWSFHNCVGRSGRWVVTIWSNRHSRWTIADATQWTGAMANRSTSIIWDVFCFKAISNVSHATRTNRSVIEGTSIPSCSYWRGRPAFCSRKRWRCVCRRLYTVFSSSFKSLYFINYHSGRSSNNISFT